MTGNIAAPIGPLRPSDPTRLGPYQLTGRIGRGGMGTVFLAVTDTGERAAVKVINPDLADDDSFRDRFRREVESARRVRRFCTAPVLDAQLDGEPLFIVTEYVDGPNLEETVETGGPLRGANLEGLAVGVATALTAIHGAGVVHRDLKPANVLLSSVGPRVIDFGIARALDTVAQATRTGLFIGTPSYMAPELVSGERATPASDIFAWGCVMAFAATGRPLFEAATAPAVLYQIVHAQPSLDDIDPGMRAIVEQALAKDPRDRPAAQELLDRLVGQEHADTALGADTAQNKWPADAVPGRAATLAVPPPGGPVPPEATRAGQPPVPHDPTRVAPPDGVPAADGAHGFGHGLAGHGALHGAQHGSYGTAHAAAGHGAPAGSYAPTKAGRPGSRRRPPWLPWAVAGGAAFATLVAATTIYLVTGNEAPPESTTAVFGDDFSATDSGWSGSTFSSGYGYQQGTYRMDAGTNTYDATKIQEAPYKSALPERALVSATIRVASGPAYAQAGLMCRGNDDPTGYQFLVRADGKQAMIRKVVKDAGSRELAKQAVTAEFKAKGANLVQAACEKETGRNAVRLRMWINGELAVQATDADRPLPTAAAGLVVTRESGGSGGVMTTHFDDFKIDEITGS